MLVAYRDDGFWTQLWYRCFRTLIGGQIARLPGPGFVGQESPSFRGTGARRARLKSTRMRRLVSTPGARLWRLTCVWVPLQAGQEKTPPGSFSEVDGSSWGVGGVEISPVASQGSTAKNKTTST